MYSDEIGKLLIVPYGIETIDPGKEKTLLWLLIVPYGIETSTRKSLWAQKSFLLIVPYGIET